ncbi:Exodeoxyribonuclease VII large subunit [Coriobacterium glomerans PW2]|uniref:Exodeoxyribonuclease 7 large subunit n=1 Tax=Coriobacterium glomerans (strain ATCC 49209 / DSM 20642 / JCM 10262 / PW2) TaxID=700015 RepID=F2NBP3_CORGP|nr:exodeoxyribonuclease VII large subunit [Coriobacterium glomerans]AEB06852.1 Exodeoxyribonuclease VII large subunit [Coriobacterium glomerans PW2]
MSGWDLTGGVRDAGEGALTVSQAVQRASDALETIPSLTVIGEVTGFRGPNARSGHCYFQIKDEAAAVDCIIWRGAYAKRPVDLRDGMQAQFTGAFNLYKPQGRMSFVARSFALAGEGLLRQQVAALAEKLRREGLMEEARKRPIAAFCSRVAVVTSLSGAVIDDVKRTLRRRNPLVELICVGAKVQGEGAADELIEGLRRAASTRPAPDCILLVRGGGSFEDLMTFNDERLARAVAGSPVPVVTGIGHEPDTSICDMVSDRRASTPTAAAESVAPDMSDLIEVLSSREHRIALAMAARVRTAAKECAMLEQRDRRAISGYLDRAQMTLSAWAARPCLLDPTQIVDRRRSELAQTSDRLAQALVRAQARYDDDLARLVPRFKESASRLSDRRHELVLSASRLSHVGRDALADARSGLASDAASLDALSPLAVLARGYSIAYGDAGVAGSIELFSAGDEMRLRMVDGELAATVTSVSPGEACSDGSSPAAPRSGRG